MNTKLTVALIGNPNCGKTTIFNALTGSRQMVGNWPGVTVERKSGAYQFHRQHVTVVDLPGTYYLSQCGEKIALDEKVACDYILSHDANLIINIIDGSNLERNLYLTLQLIELGVPLLVVVNMTDILHQRGLRLDVKALEAQLKCPVIALQASKAFSAKLLKQAIHDCSVSVAEARIVYHPVIEEAIHSVQAVYTHSKRHQAIQALEAAVEPEVQIPVKIREIRQGLEQVFNQETDIIFAEARYQRIDEIVEKSLRRVRKKTQTTTAFLDKIVLNRFLGLPIFLFVMYLMFFVAINIGGAFQDFFDISSDVIFIQGLSHLLVSLHAPGWLVALIAAGIGKGINTTITFIPVIGMMFLFLAFLQSSGYMARAAFVVDRFMRAIGLPGKSFVPMIVGFGCNVPAIMGCRTLENKRDRIMTILMTPFMSCGARLAIFAVFTAAFFKTDGSLIVFALYLIGIVMAVLTGLLLQITLLSGEPSAFVMELPPYHFPRFNSLLLQAWQRLKIFIFKAGKIIIPVCILISALNAVNIHGELVSEKNKTQSILSVAGRAMTPIFHPMGVEQDNWPATLGLITGTLAKEVVVGTLNTLYVDVGHLHQQAESFQFLGGLKQAVMTIPENLTGLGDALKNPILASESRTGPITRGVYGQMATRFGSPAAAFAYLLFILLYVPCVSTVAVIARELNRRWAIFSVTWMILVAYGVAVIFYQAVSFAQHPGYSLISIGLCLGLFVLIVLGLSVYARSSRFSGKRGLNLR